MQRDSLLIERLPPLPLVSKEFWDDLVLVDLAFMDLFMLCVFIFDTLAICLTSMALAISNRTFLSNCNLLF